MKIFIDNYPDQEEFAKDLAVRISKSNENFEVEWFSRLFNAMDTFNDDSEVELTGIESSDLIIPIITPEYLSNTEIVVIDKLNEIYANPKKFLIPFLYMESNWSSENWIVKSKAFPVDGIAFAGLSNELKEKTISEFVRTLNDIHFAVNYSNTHQIFTKKEKSKDIKKSVFISHDHDDADFAELLKLQLEKENIDSWIDSERLKIGQDWREEIDSGISDSIAIIVIMTPDARKSEYVTYEWAYAWGKGIKIFPVMLKQTQLHPRLESLQYLDFTNRVTRPWKDLIDSLKEL